MNSVSQQITGCSSSNRRIPILGINNLVQDGNEPEAYFRLSVYVCALCVRVCECVCVCALCVCVYVCALCVCVCASRRAFRASRRAFQHSIRRGLIQLDGDY